MGQCLLLYNNDRDCREAQADIGTFPANTQRRNNVVTTTLQRHFSHSSLISVFSGNDAIILMMSSRVKCASTDTDPPSFRYSLDSRLMQKVLSLHKR